MPPLYDVSNLSELLATELSVYESSFARETPAAEAVETLFQTLEQRAGLSEENINFFQDYPEYQENLGQYDQDRKQWKKQLVEKHYDNDARELRSVLKKLCEHLNHFHRTMEKIELRLILTNEDNNQETYVYCGPRIVITDLVAVKLEEINQKTGEENSAEDIWGNKVIRNACRRIEQIGRAVSVNRYNWDQEQIQTELQKLYDLESSLDFYQQQAILNLHNGQQLEKLQKEYIHFVVSMARFLGIKAKLTVFDTLKSLCCYFSQVSTNTEWREHFDEFMGEGSFTLEYYARVLSKLNGMFDLAWPNLIVSLQEQFLSAFVQKLKCLSATYPKAVRCQPIQNSLQAIQELIKTSVIVSDGTGFASDFINLKETIEAVEKQLPSTERLQTKLANYRSQYRDQQFWYQRKSGQLSQSSKKDALSLLENIGTVLAECDNLVVSNDDKVQEASKRIEKALEELRAWKRENSPVRTNSRHKQSKNQFRSTLTKVVERKTFEKKKPVDQKTPAEMLQEVDAAYAVQDKNKTNLLRDVKQQGNNFATRVKRIDEKARGARSEIATLRQAVQSDGNRQPVELLYQKAMRAIQIFGNQIGYLRTELTKRCEQKATIKPMESKNTKRGAPEPNNQGRVLRAKVSLTELITGSQHVIVSQKKTEATQLRQQLQELQKTIVYLPEEYIKRITELDSSFRHKNYADYLKNGKALKEQIESHKEMEKDMLDNMILFQESNVVAWKEEYEKSPVTSQVALNFELMCHYISDAKDSLTAGNHQQVRTWLELLIIKRKDQSMLIEGQEQASDSTRNGIARPNNILKLAALCTTPGGGMWRPSLSKEPGLEIIHDTFHPVA